MFSFLVTTASDDWCLRVSTTVKGKGSCAFPSEDTLFSLN